MIWKDVGQHLTYNAKERENDRQRNDYGVIDQCGKWISKHQSENNKSKVKKERGK